MLSRGARLGLLVRSSSSAPVRRTSSSAPIALDSVASRQRRPRDRAPRRPVAVVGRRSSSSSSSSSSFPPRRLADLEARVLSRVRDERDPVLGAPLSDLRWIRGPRVVARRGDENEDDDVVLVVDLTLRVPTLLHPGLEELVGRLRTVASEAVRDDDDDDGSVRTEVRVDVRRAPFSPDGERGTRSGPGLDRVAHAVAVYSCKGGVGKSTVATNLAYALARKGGRIGLLDADVHGPSLPILVRPSDPTVRRSDLGAGMVRPIEHEGVKLLSLGFVSPKSGVPGSGGADSSSGAAVVRGPMASKVVTQLLKGTEWGDLDVLLVDLPPGTGDVQLTVCQELELDGAVSVTTPSKLAVADAKKGLEMFDALGVPTLAMVENMAYFECEGGGRHHPFGRGIDDPRSLLPPGVVVDDDDVPPLVRIPASEVANDAVDEGAPIALFRPPRARTEIDRFDELADAVAERLLRRRYAAASSSSSNQQDVVSIGGEEWETSTLRLSADLSSEGEERFVVRLFSDAGAREIPVSAEDLRFAHPRTGRPVDDDAAVVAKRPGRDDDDDDDGMVTRHRAGGELSPSGGRRRFRRKLNRRLFPATVEKRGNYGYAIAWADGATIIYTTNSIANVAANAEPRFLE